MQSFLREFKEFALRGNMVDLAIGIIIGAAFSGLVNSLVQDIIMPLVGIITGGVDFTNKYIALAPGVTAASLAEARKEGAVLAYGNFLTLAINFIIVALVLFVVVKIMNNLKRKEEQKPPVEEALPRDQQLLEEIRDLLAVRLKGDTPSPKV
ncbi:large conductance mechanosensitive channel protein MscL [Consotaella salsifontis]|uniref:Large-conductance mechanosensitive channel n=1 Tax=Consotaella salsifontis TaxID=1365950 RepID=A0A1T4MM75_9HYPH|nr:large conductance mechanosensitive channel protein MscL [Consotaella salsifontis]SJZ68230.1 large conductance mechanosensitive channel [Consotaella salsifontis]